QGDSAFYKSYTDLRDRYLELSSKELSGLTISEKERLVLNQHYDNFIKRYGFLNNPANNKRIIRDEAFGLTILSSLERREDGKFVKADFLKQSVVKQQQRVTANNPLDALVHSLNQKGGV